MNRIKTIFEIEYPDFGHEDSAKFFVYATPEKVYLNIQDGRFLVEPPVILTHNQFETLLLLMQEAAEKLKRVRPVSDIPAPTYPPGATWEPIPQSEYQDDEYHIFWGEEEPSRAASWRHGRLPRTQEEIMANLPAGKTYICMRRKPEEAE